MLPKVNKSHDTPPCLYEIVIITFAPCMLLYLLFNPTHALF